MREKKHRQIQMGALTEAEDMTMYTTDIKILTSQQCAIAVKTLVGGRAVEDVPAWRCIRDSWTVEGPTFG